MDNLTMRLDLADGNWSATTGMTSGDVERFVHTWLSGSTEQFQILARQGVFDSTFDQIDAIHITR